MIYLILGDDPFLVKKNLKEIIEKEKEKKGRISVIEVDVGKTTFPFIAKSFLGNEIFKQNKLLVLKSPSRNKPFMSDFMEFFRKKELPEVSFVFLEKDPLFKDISILKFIKERGSVVKILKPKRSEIKRIVEQKAREKGYLLDLQIADFLIAACDENLSHIFVELEKLMAYKVKEKNIKKQDALFLVKPRIETEIFKTVDSIAQKNKKEAMKLIQNHLKNGDPPLYLFKMIIFQFRNLLSVKDREEKYKGSVTTGDFSDMHPFVVKKSLYQAKKFTLFQLKRIYKKLFQIDLAMKKGKITPQVGLELFILDL